MFIQTNKPITSSVKLTENEFDLLCFINQPKHKAMNKLNLDSEGVRLTMCDIRNKGIDVSVISDGYQDNIRVAPKDKERASLAIRSYFQANQ